jgi:hypothetical protein
VRVAVALVSNVGEFPVLVVADEFVLLGLVEKEGIDGVPLLLPFRDLFEEAREFEIPP